MPAGFLNRPKILIHSNLCAYKKMYEIGLDKLFQNS